ncbi:MAG: [protein-PII] uridylyltransferase [Ignavibacteriales bacterium]|nr:[protein-PII] uridylyltransferase [Ignavibacteriales bacterium]
MTETPALKKHFQNTLRIIADRHRDGEGGIRVSLSLTRALDEVLIHAFRASRHPSKSSFCIVCVGGYGRKELCFASDTDIMFLLPDTASPEAAFAVQSLLHDLLDLGLDIGHSVRTIEDCLSLRETDFESWVSLLESRFLCGNRALYGRFRKELQARIKTGDKGAFVKEVFHRMEERHAKYGQSTTRLEPNIKNSAGGLRDLHTVLWLLLGTGSVPLFTTLPPRETAVTHLFKSPFLRGHVPAALIRDMRSAFGLLLRTRNAMHLESKGLHDSLEFTFQRQVSESLRVSGTPTRTSVEHFMQGYYVTARTVAHFSRRVGSMVQRLHLRSPVQDETILDAHCVLRGDRIAPRKRFTATNVILLQACQHAMTHGAEFSEDMEDLLSRQFRRLKALRTRSEAALFRAILNSPTGVSRVLHSMNNLGVLERWIPEWKPMVAFFQHNQYHFYTADEHTLRVVAAAEGLQNDQGPLGTTFRALPRRETLYYACLFHDIAKPERVMNHEERGAARAEAILKRLHVRDISSDVSFLVRHHLLMEQIAFRRNLSDPQTVIDFVSKIPHPQLLDYLYVLTYADLSAVNKSVWTDWKGMLLYELYRKAKEVLEKRLTSEEVRLAASSRHTEAVQELVRRLAGVVPEESSQNHLEAVDNVGYLAAFNADEIAEHIRRIERNEPVATLFRHQGTVTEVTIIARDAPFALSRFCGVLSANDANILDAHIFTRTDGVIIDKFRVTDFLQRSRLSESQCAKIRRELSDVIAGRTDIRHLLERHRMKWKRLTKQLNPNARMDVEFEDHPVYTIIDVFAPDRLGFLYKITESISRLGLNIQSAKIATRADGIVDSFYVLDRNGRRLEDPFRREEVRAELLRTVQETAGLELTPLST